MSTTEPYLSLTPRRYPAFQHLLLIGAIHTAVGLLFTVHHIRNHILSRMSGLPRSIQVLFILESMMGLVTIRLAFWAKARPLEAAWTNVALYAMQGALMAYVIHHLRVRMPPDLKLRVHPMLMCAIILAALMIKSLAAANTQCREFPR